MASMSFPVSIIEIGNAGWPLHIDAAWSESHPRSLFEPAEVEDSQYSAWDASGRPVRVFVANDKVQIEPIETAPQLEELKSIIFKYANDERFESRFSDEYPNSTVADLWDRATKHMKAMGFWRTMFRRLGF